MRNKKFFSIIPILAILCFVLIILAILFREQIEYSYESIILANRSTVIFSCSEFGSKNELDTIYDMLVERDDPLLSDIQDAGGMLGVVAVGERCPDKYQFEITFEGDSELDVIQNIIPGQTIEGKPVFLRNV